MFHILRKRLSHLQRRFRSDDRGALAIEFAAVVMPFVTLLFGTVAVGMYFFVTFSLENAVEQAARQIRTGQAQLASMTKNQFKADVCAKAPGFIDCVSYLRVDVVEYTNFAAITPPDCINSSTGKLIDDPANNPVPGAAGNVVLVIVCYEWKLAGMLPFLKLGSMNNGSSMIQAATTFRTEPYS